jgi:hypothetical protein
MTLRVYRDLRQTPGDVGAGRRGHARAGGGDGVDDRMQQRAAGGAIAAVIEPAGVLARSGQERDLLIAVRPADPGQAVEQALQRCFRLWVFSLADGFDAFAHLRHARRQTCGKPLAQEGEFRIHAFTSRGRMRRGTSFEITSRRSSEAIGLARYPSA